MIIKDLIDVLHNLAFIDYILYFSILALIVLVCVLYYVLKFDCLEEEKKVEKMVEEEFDLQDVINNIDEKPAPLIDMTVYEEEQEKKAIISYDELINEAKKNNNINYEEEKIVDDCISTRKINLSNIITDVGSVEPKEEYEFKEKKDVHAVLFKYEHEEAFLKALKELNELLN